MKDTECVSVPELHAHEHISKPSPEDRSALLLVRCRMLGNATADHATDSISNKDSDYARSSIAGVSSGPSLQHRSLCWEGAFYKPEAAHYLPSLFFTCPFWALFCICQLSCRENTSSFFPKQNTASLLLALPTVEHSGKLAFPNPSSELLLLILFWGEGGTIWPARRRNA